MSFLDWTTAGSYSYTVPHGVKSITVRMRGGGAGSQATTGGGGGAYVRHTFSCSPGDVFNFDVGGGGANGNAGVDTVWNSGQFVAGGAPGQAGGSASWSGGLPDYYENGGNGGNGAQCCGSLDCSGCINQTCGVDCGSQDCSDCTEGQTCGEDCGSTDCSDCINQTCGVDCGNTPCGSWGGGGGSSGGEDGPNNGTDAGCSDENTGTDGVGGTAPTEGGRGGDGSSNSGLTNGGGAGGNANAAGGEGYVIIEWTAGHIHLSTVPNGTANAPLGSFTATAQFSDNTTDTSFTGNITLGLYANPGSSTLSGTTAVGAISGVSTYTDISLNHGGIGYQLYAADFGGEFDPATSNTFDITALVEMWIRGADVPNPRVGPPILRRGWQQRPLIQSSAGTIPSTDEPSFPLETEVFLVAPIIVAANTYWVQPVNLPNPKVGPPVLRQKWRQPPQYLLGLDNTVNLAMAPMSVEAGIVNPPIVTANTYWVQPVDLPNPRVGPPALRRQWHQKPPLVADSSVTATNLAMYPMQVEVRPLNSPLSVSPPAGSHANSTKFWFNGLPFQGTDGLNTPLPYWWDGLPSRPLISSSPIALFISGMQVQLNQVAPPLQVGAALAINPLQVETREVPVSQVGGVNALIFPLSTELTVASAPRSDVTLALPAMQVETRSNIQATTSGAGLALPPLQVMVGQPGSPPTGSPSITLGFPVETDLVNVVPNVSASISMAAMSVEQQYAASVTGGATVDMTAQQVMEMPGFNKPIITPEVVASLQQIETELLSPVIQRDINLSLSLQEAEPPVLYRIHRLTGGVSNTKFAEIERSSSSIVIYGSEPHQPFKFNPSATSFRRNGPTHTIHLARVKPDFTTISAVFELLTPFAELQPNEFLYESPGGFLRIYNDAVIQSSLIQDGDTPAIAIASVPANQVFTQSTLTSFALQRQT